MRIMKTNRLLSFLFTVIASVAQALAVPADPTPRQVAQPDGTTVTLRKIGDERGFIYLTTDGLPVVRDAVSGYYEYARLEKGCIIASGLKAADPENRDKTSVTYTSRMDAKGILSQFTTTLQNPSVARKRMKAAPRKVRISDYPTVGSPRTLVILVEFSDTKFSTTDGAPFDYYNGLLNEEGFTHRNGADGSARDFYLASSNGRFSPQFDVVGPITLPETCAYYGADRLYEEGGQLYREIDVNAPRMVEDACRIADSEVDFSRYDENHDGVVDNIYFFYAGYGQADSDKTDVLWPHAGTMTDWGVDLELDGMVIDHYACSHEIRGGSSPLAPVGIGTFVHEFGHVLGLADHYDTLSSSGRTGVNDWDTMAGASYHNSQNTPPLFNAFERAELGWLEYTDINPDAHGVLNTPLLREANKAYRITVPATDGNEYFVIENRDKEGWDSFLPGTGLLVWHVDMDEEAWINNQVNVLADHQRLDLVEADGMENATSYTADPFPGRKEVRQFDFYDWSKSVLFSFDDVRENEESIDFVLGNTDFVPGSPSVKMSDLHGTMCSLSWEEIPDAYGYEFTLRKIGSDGNAVPVEEYEGLFLTERAGIDLTGLEPLTNYEAEVTTRIASYLSTPSRVNISTGQLEFFESRPEALAASNFGSGSFTANWLPLENAMAYSVSLYRHEFCIPLSEGYGFDQRHNGLPSEWSTSSTQYNLAYFGESSPSLQMNNEGDYLLFDYPAALLTRLSFWCRSQTNKNILHVEILDNDEWKEVASFPTTISEERHEIDVNHVGKTRIRLERSSGYSTIDDVELQLLGLEDNLINGYENLNAGNSLSFTFTGLDQDGVYAYRVRGIRGAELSAESESIIVSLSSLSQIDVPVVSPNSEHIQLYDIFGRRVSNSTASPGIYIRRDGNHTTKIIINKRNI